MELNHNLSNTTIFNVLKEKCIESGDHEVISLVNSIYEFSKNKLKSVIKNLPEFTLHDEEHIYNMLTIVSKIVPQKSLNNLSVPELMLIIISICLHDIGMSPEEECIKSWKNQSDNEGLSKEQIMEKNEFVRFRNTQFNLIREIDILNNNKEHSKAQLLEDLIISNFIRTTHSLRAKRIISKDWGGKIIYRDTDLTACLASICFSHTEDYSYVLNMETFCICGDDIYLCIPFIAVILRLCDIVDFDPKRTPRVLYSHLAVSNPVSLKEWNKHLSINAWTINSRKLIYSAQCSHPAIEAAIKQFCDLIDIELRNCTLILSNIDGEDFEINVEKYQISLPAQVNRDKIQAHKDIETGLPVYKYNNSKFTLSKNQVIDLLMGTKLYGKPEVALRELIQNSIDACLLRGKLHEKWGEPYKPEIVIKFEHNGDVEYLEIIDNGIGMNQYIIDNYYSNIGSSYYKSNEFFELIGSLKTTYTPISRFGIGILACFMVSDHLEVNTRRIIDQYECDESLRITIEGSDSLFVITDSNRKTPGTTTKLKLRKQHPWEKLNEDRFIESVKRVVPNPPFDLIIKTSKIEETHSLLNTDFFDLNQIKDYSWSRMNNISTFRIDIDDEEKGLRGVCDIAIITTKNKVAEDINITSKDVEVDGENYTLSMDIKYGRNCIEKRSDTISVNDDGQVEVDSSYTRIFNSNSLLSIHGIEVPCQLFPDLSTLYEKAVLNFPLPLAFKIDIYGDSDLNLNSARTKVIYDEKWLKFESDLYEVINRGLALKLGDKKWGQLKTIMISKTKSNVLENLLQEM